MEIDQFKNPRTLTADEELKLQKQKEMTDFKKNKLEIEAQKNWNKFYKRNGSNFFKDRHWTRSEFSDIFNDVDLKQPIVFLEAGCGVGNMLFPLVEYFSNWQLFGFDFSANAVEQLQERAIKENINVCAKVLDITAGSQSNLEFPLADLVTFIFVLSAIHPEKHAQAIRNLCTFVKSGGSVFVRDYGALDHAMVRFGRDAKIFDRFYARQDGTRAFYFYVEEMKALFEANGFKTEMCEYLFKKTTNFGKKIDVDRVFVQARFRKIC